MKKLYVVLAALLIATMVLTACGKAATPAPATQPPATMPPATMPPATEPPATATEPPAAFRVGEVSDFGGVNDKSFNQMAWEGVEKANTDLKTDGKFLQSQVQADYAKNIQQFLDEKSDMEDIAAYYSAGSKAAGHFVEHAAREAVRHFLREHRRDEPLLAGDFDGTLQREPLEFDAVVHDLDELSAVGAELVVIELVDHHVRGGGAGEGAGMTAPPGDRHPAPFAFPAGVPKHVSGRRGVSPFRARNRRGASR